MPQFSFSRHVASRMFKQFASRRLLQGLCLISACGVSLALGFFAGSSRSGARAGLTVKADGPFHASVSEAADSLSTTSSMDAPVSLGADQAVSGQSARFDALSAPGHAIASSQNEAVAATSARSSSGSHFQPVALSLPLTDKPETLVIDVPLIYQNVNPAAVGLSAAQVAGIDKMRNDFNAKVGASSSPADPAYAQTWASAQALMDERLRAFLGWQQFNLYQINAARHR